MFGSNKIKAKFIFEILGKPPEHIKNALEEFINKLGENKGLEITSRKVHEPKPLEDKNAKDLFTTFAEVEIKADNLNTVFAIVLNMLPAHVEIIEPEEIKLNNFDLSFVLSDLSVKLHKYDEIAKISLLERNKLLGIIKELEQKVQDLDSGNNKDKKEKVKKKKKR
ncbi:MAG: hypothetical protein PHF67_03610 [Candidatus Nanoarchaeia archaeon]|nr:hypothetical protein [Candidatus Nanoarchaeia archaeon]